MKIEIKTEISNTEDAYTKWVFSKGKGLTATRVYIGKSNTKRSKLVSLTNDELGQLRTLIDAHLANKEITSPQG